MKYIGVLRRDGKPVHNGMALVISTLMKSAFSTEDISVFCDLSKEFTQMIICPMSTNVNGVLNFIEEVSEVNPMYAVRIVDKD